MVDAGLRARACSCCSSTSLVCWRPAISWDPSAIVLIMAPILYPVAVKLGVNPIHLGILMAVNMEVGMCHPPDRP